MKLITSQLIPYEKSTFDTDLKYKLTNYYDFYQDNNIVRFGSEVSKWKNTPTHGLIRKIIMIVQMMALADNL
ncbi:hypothetical protein wKueTS_06280 [Wolbachia pipientis]